MGDTPGPVQRLAGRAWALATQPLYRNAFLIMLSSVVGSGLGFFFWLVVGRYYATTDVGYAVAIIQSLSFLAALAHLGLGTAIIRYLPETERQADLVNASATIVGGLALLFSVVFILGVTVFVPDLSFIQANPIYPVVILATTLGIALPTLYDQASYAVRRADVLLWRTTALALVKIPLALAFALFALTAGRLGIFLSLGLGYVVGVVLEALVLLPRVLRGFRPKPLVRLAPLRPLFRFSLGNYTANSIAAAGGMLLPILILNVVGPTGAASVAFYYVGSIVAGLLSIIPGAVFTSFYAEASQKNARRAADERRAILLSIGLLIPAIGVLWFFSETMLTWFGNPAYASGAVGVLHILIFGSIPGFLNSILGTRIRIRKKSAPLIVGSAISTVVILGLGVYLLKEYGIDGLAVAAVVGSAAATPYYYLVARTSFKGEQPPAEPTVPVQA